MTMPRDDFFHGAFIPSLTNVVIANLRKRNRLSNKGFDMKRPNINL
jgi:hypothetical protein